MTRTRILLTIAASVCLLGTATLAADLTAPAGTSPRNPHKGPPPSPEMDAYHRLVLTIYDADKDGILDETERAVLHEDIASGKMEPPPGPPPGRGRIGPPPEILARYDTDKDGTLNETERAALEADIAAGKLPPPGRGHGHKPPFEDSGTAQTGPSTNT